MQTEVSTEEQTGVHTEVQTEVATKAVRCKGAACIQVNRMNVHCVLLYTLYNTVHGSIHDTVHLIIKFVRTMQIVAIVYGMPSAGHTGPHVLIVEFVLNVYDQFAGTPDVDNCAENETEYTALKPGLSQCNK